MCLHLCPYAQAAIAKNNINYKSQIGRFNESKTWKLYSVCTKQSVKNCRYVGIRRDLCFGRQNLTYENPWFQNGQL